MSKRAIADEEDGGLFDEDSDEEEEEGKETNVPRKKRKADASSAKKKKKPKGSFIDDAAEESGEEGGGSDDEDEDDDDDDNDDYVKDGFVVDEDEEDVRRKKKGSGDLEDSDDDDDVDDSDDDVAEEKGPRKKKAKKFRKVRELDRLADEDLDLIREARGETEQDRLERLEIEREEAARRKVVAQSEEELRKGLFYDSAGEEDDMAARKKEKQRRMVERYDEDGMDDFIDDDIGDQGDIIASDRRAAYEGPDGAGGVSEAQLNEASEIFGTDYLEFMQQDDQDYDEEDLFGRKKYRERGVGVDLGVDSESEDFDDDEDDDDDLFGDDDEDGVESGQKAEALKLRREKRELARKERRQQKVTAKQEQRKARLRKAFEPIQLIENFCTDRDDDIRSKDVPERFFDWNVPFHGETKLEAEISPEEEEEALWIMNQIPVIRSEYTAPTESIEKMEEQEKSVVHSIAHALRFIHLEKLEPAFIKRYRQDVVTSPAVRESLYQIMDEDAEWEIMVNAKAKVDAVLDGITHDMLAVDAASAQAVSVAKLEQALVNAEQKLEETAIQETEVKSQLEAIGLIEEKDDEEEDDDELFGDDDDDQEKNAKKEKKESMEKHLATIQALLEDRSEKVSEIQKQLVAARIQANESSPDREPALRVAKKISRDHLWNDEDLVDYLAGLTDIRHIVDVHVYLGLLKEGNDAIRTKEMPLAKLGADGKSEKNSRSRRFDRDFYRTCVSEGHRDIAYRFLLAPNRAGIKLEEFATKNKFDYARMMPGEDAPHPQNWLAPTVQSKTPREFASELVGSGELVLLSSTNGMDSEDAEAKDPLRGCRYVAAMELAHEPRIRRHLRSIYRRHAVLTTRPTKKGLDTIDAFHDYYGLHLIKDKPIKEHFAMDENESAERRKGLTPEECNELDTEMKRRERNSCLQYLNILKAEKTRHVHVHVHLPLAEVYDEWYALGDVYNSRDKQDLKVLMDELEKLYFPLDGDSEEWNNERKKVLTHALVAFLLPQFESETRRELREAAVKVGVIDAGESLYKMAMEGPYRPHALNHLENRFLVPTGELPIVGICCPADTKEALYFASVSEQGELLDHLAVPSGSRVDGQAYREKVIKFLMQNRPAAVLIGTSGGFESRLLSRKMNDIVNEAVQRWENRGIQGEDEDDEDHEARLKEIAKMVPHSFPDDDESLNWTCNVDLVDDSVSQLFGRSVRGTKEFPEHPQNLRIAASIARHGQDPLSELTYAWSVASDTGNFGAELLYIDVHPMQQLLPSFMLLRQYERSLCEVVAEVGVDFNKTCKQTHLHGLLTFVPGLGPRKAASLKQNVMEGGGIIASRRALLEKRLIGPIVYNNAVAFLRIRETEQIYEIGATLHPLDDTRLHPDVYQRNSWAVKIATDALERVEGEGKNKQAAALKALRDVMYNSAQEVQRLYNTMKEDWVARFGPTFRVADWDPRKIPAEKWRDKVEELDLDTFATMIEQTGHGKRHSHLQMIKWEFRLPFVDPRNPMEALTGDRLFRLITGETEQTLRPGKEVTGKVVSNGDFGCRIKLEGDVSAFIPLRNLSDEHVETAEDIVTPGMLVTAVITEVKKDHMCVDMSLKLEDFRRPLSQWERPSSLPAIDAAFDRVSSASIDEKKTKEREARLEAMRLTMSSTKLGEDGDDSKKKRGRVARRACTHPAFRNSRNDEVNRELKDRGAEMVGEALIRPSSKSADSLAIHWVVREGTIKVIEVIEEDKDTDASIGNVLKIKDEAYGSIDELLGRYIAPMNDYVEELTNHRKFVDLPEDELDDKLRVEKIKNPKGVFYNVCWMELHPGYASLRFILSNNPRHHTVGISSSGFVWGPKTYTSMDLLLNEFKRNPKGVSLVRRPAPPPSQPVEPKTEDMAPRASRWGSKAAAPPVGWGVAQQSLRPPPPPAQGWNAPVAAGWQQPPPPPVGGYGRPPPPMRPPPPVPPPYQQNPQYQYQQPPAPPGY